MALRVAFDLDGVLADMESELVRQAELLFGEPMTRRLEERASDAPPTDPPTETPNGSEEQRQASAETAPENVPPLIKLNMTTRQQRRLWKHVESIENFWLTLEELEPGVIQRLAAIAAERRGGGNFFPKGPPHRRLPAAVPKKQLVGTQRLYTARRVRVA